jgi:hypothetical protein
MNEWWTRAGDSWAIPPEVEARTKPVEHIPAWVLVTLAAVPMTFLMIVFTVLAVTHL